MNKLYAYFLLTVLLLAELPLKAAPVSEDSARTVAANVLGTTQLVNRTAELPSDIGQYMYLFSPEGGVGFVLISADDCALPVLGYSTTSTMNFAVEGFSSWLSHSKTQIANIRSQGLAASTRVAALWTQLMDGGPVLTGASVAPMLTTAWGADVRYRRFSPVTSSGYECHPGQIAVAMAQIMKYWNYPPRGLGSVSYTNTGDVAAQVTADFSTAYDWDNMPDVLTDASSDAEKDAVNEIIFHAGAAIQTIYRVNNSPMQGGNIYAAFRNNFRYNTQTVRTINTRSFTHAAYDEMMMAEITSGRPFLYRNGNVYYCFVVDGCDGWGQYHVNWGNAGSNNGYFALGSLNPEVYTYPWSVISVVGIEPLTLYAISVQSNNDEWGSVNGGGSYVVGERVALEATPVFGVRFLRWSDGNTNNPRTFNASENLDLTAVFEWVGIVDIQVEPNNASWGTVSGIGSYTVGDIVHQQATPAFGYAFSHWSDGSTENPRRFSATEDRDDIAYFVYVGTANINAVADNAERGSVSGTGTYTIGDNVVLTAMPVSGWLFDHWEDGSIDNPRTIVASESRTYTACFVRPGEGRPELYMVELDDRENHAWSYYSDPTCLVRSLNPADVKIRYFGYGQNTMYSSDALQPIGNPDVDVSPVMVGIGIDAPWKNTYVYHKTLERVNGEQAESMAAADGPCFYSLIPNPYSRRPTHGTGNTRWRGFYKWRLKAVSGGTVFRDMAMTQPVTAGTMLDAEDTVFFLPAAEYGMEVDFEAIWARAAVFPTVLSLDTSAVGAYVTGKNAYERNFVVHTCNDCLWERNASGADKDFTITSVFPDGTDGVSPVLLTEVPSFGSLGGDRLTHSKLQLNQVSIMGRNCGDNVVPATAYIGDLTLGSDAVTTGTTTLDTRQPFFFPWEAIKFEYIKLSLNHSHKRYHAFCPRSCATQKDDTTWYVVTNPSSLGANGYYFNRGDTIWLKVYNGDTLYAACKVGEPTNWSDTTFQGQVKYIKAGQWICGRMCLPEDGCNFFLYNGLIFGIGRAELASSREKAVRWRLESGQLVNSSGSAQHSISPTHLSNGNTVNVNGVISCHVVLGSDYDRSRGDNGKLSVGSLCGAWGCYYLDPVNKSTNMFNYIFKSGVVDGAYLGDNGMSGGYYGARVFTMEGGKMQASITAGMDGPDSKNCIDSNFTQVRIYLKGGSVARPVVGGAARLENKGHRRMIFTGGSVYGWISGGCNGIRADGGGSMRGNTYIYFGGKAHLLYNTMNDVFFNASKGGNLFGAGSGHSADTGDASTVGRVNNSHVVVADSAYIVRDVYGGGNYGHVRGDSSAIQILGGTVAGRVFGGSNRQKAPRISIEMRDGHVLGGIYGGSNALGKVKGPVKVHIKGGTVGSPGCADTIGNVFGCGYGARTLVTGDVEVIIGREDTKTPHLDSPTIHGNVYCGGFMGAYNATGRLFRVTTYNGRIVKSVYGGGFGTSATIAGNTNVNILGTTYVGGNVYGGGNMGKVTGNTLVVIGDDTSSYTLGVQSANTARGTVSGGGLYQAGTVASISATPASGYRFKQWNDGNTQNPRTITVVGDAVYTAQFEAIPVRTITVAVADGHSAMGTVSGGGNYREGQAVSISATPASGYRFKQWNDGNTQNPRTITVVGNATYTAQFMEDPFNWVDLGLPSRLLWADANLGAESPEQYGDYYAWGETTTKSSYSWNTYKYCRGSMNTLTKYCDISTNGYNGYTDNLTTLQPEDDVATATLGGDARIPTSAEWREMINNTTQTNETLNGVAGRRFTSKINGNSIFIPFGGHMDGTNLARGGSSAEHWTASYGTFTPSTAEMFFANSSNGSVSNGSRLFGFNIRAVRGGN